MIDSQDRQDKSGQDGQDEINDEGRRRGNE
jgi:hypothetical protein